MKTVSILFAVIGLATMNSLGQGYFNADNFGSGVFLEIADPAVNGGVLTKVGKPAAAAGFFGAGPGQVTISMYAALSGTSLAALEASTPIATVQNTSSPIDGVQGTFVFGNPFTLPTVAGVFDGSAAIEVIFLAETAEDLGGWSAEGVITPAISGNLGSAPSIFGFGPGQIDNFILEAIPEPSAIGLCGFGVALLLFLSRCKSTAKRVSKPASK